MLGIDFGWYSFYRGNFAPIAPNESCSICSGVLVDFKFSMDFPENEQICRIHTEMHVKLCKHPQSLAHIEISDISLISWMSVISLKSGDFIKIDNISCKYTKR